MEVWGLKTCDTSRKALAVLPGAAFRDVRAQSLNATEIAALLVHFGPALINRSSTTWRGLSPEQQTQDPATLLATHPTLMKRPVIRHGDSWHLGWTPATRAALGL